MPFYDFNNKDEEITLEKLLENYKFLEYITQKKYKESPLMKLLKERTEYRKAINMLKRVLKKKNENETMSGTI